jgi:hypothetical protein
MPLKEREPQAFSLYQIAVLICVASCQVYAVIASAAPEFAQMLKAAKPPWQQDLVSI